VLSEEWSVERGVKALSESVRVREREFDCIYIYIYTGLLWWFPAIASALVSPLNRLDRNFSIGTVSSALGCKEHIKGTQREVLTG
jgi:hypothetical protein